MTEGNYVMLRLRELVLGWGTVGLVYEVSRRWQGPGTLIKETPIDQYIPYDPDAIWFYIAFFVYVPWAYCCTDRSRLQWLRRSMQVCAFACGLIYLLWPTTVAAPALSQALATDELSTTLLRWLHKVDTPQNCMPSLHAALTVLCGWALISRESGQRLFQSLLAILVGVAIGFSIIQLRRHLMVDLVAGASVGWLSGLLCRRREKQA